MTDGTLEQTAAGPRLRFVRRLPHPPERVWAAITEPEHLAAWFPDTIVVGEWRVGAALRFEHPSFSFDGEVLAVEEGRLLEFRWGTDTIRLEVEPDGDGTRLTLLDMIDALGKAARDAAGWHACLDRLAEHLAGSAEPGAGAPWRELHTGYIEAFGPDAATIGPPEGALER